MHVHHRHHEHRESSQDGYSHSSEGRLIAALLITAGFAAVELVAGWLSGSLALIGDAGHMITDVAALSLAAAAARLSRRPPSTRHSFGLQRAEVVGAFLNGIVMLAVVAWIVYEGIRRLVEPVPVLGTPVVIVAGVGLVVNLIVLKVLSRGEHTLNTRGAMVHVMGDLLGSVAALASGVVILTTDWAAIDPILSMVIAGLILISTSRLLYDALHVLMEGVPPNLNLRRVGERLAEVPGVLDVHDLHIWLIASGSVALAAHVRVISMERWPEQLGLMERLLREEFGIGHVTLQPEPPYEVAFVDVPRRAAG